MTSVSVINKREPYGHQPRSLVITVILLCFHRSLAAGDCAKVALEWCKWMKQFNYWQQFV